MVTMLGIAVIIKNEAQIFTLSLDPARLIKAEGQKFVPHFLQSHAVLNKLLITLSNHSIV